MSDDEPLSPRLSSADRLFRGLALASSLLFIALIADLIAHPVAGPISSGAPVAFRASAAVVGIGTVLVSGLIMWRVPGNAVGRFLLLFAIGFTGWQFSYAFGSERVSNTLFLIFYFYWGAIGLPALPYLIIHFPNGRIYPPRFKPWLIGFAVIKVLGSGLDIVSIGSYTLFAEVIYNPFLIDSLAPLRGLISMLLGAQSPPILLALLAAIGSITLRYRQSTLRERQQIKWLLWCTFIMASTTTLWFAAHNWDFSQMGASTAVDLPTYAVMMLYPAVAIGVGILRHHLWDIDVIIRRTVIYGIITILLGLTYFAGAAILQSIFVRFSGQQSPLATVVTTLGIAALFTPLRRRVQAFVDQRFYRHKYDAARTLEEFGNVARDEVDLEQLQHTLVTVVGETMQPTQISLWLRDDHAGRRS